MVSFFGGDHSMSHFSVSLPHRPPYASSEERKAFDEKRNEERAKLKALGWKEKYFQYKNDDKKAKAKAKKAADLFAKSWEKQSGVKLDVSEGFFL